MYICFVPSKGVVEWLKPGCKVILLLKRNSKIFDCGMPKEK